jgi:hypothetical protein
VSVEKAEMEGCLLAMRHGGLSRHRISQVTGITLLLGGGQQVWGVRSSRGRCWGGTNWPASRIKQQPVHRERPASLTKGGVWR